MDAQTPSNHDDRPSPMNLGHHYSEVTKRRGPSFLKDLYTLFTVPGMRNIAGGFPNALMFPFDTLEARTAYPGRWASSSSSAPREPIATPSSHHSRGANHIAIPRAVDEMDPTRRIDLTTALQYGGPAGYPALLSWIRHFTLKNLHPSVPYHGGPEVAMTSGSTDGFSKVVQIFIDTWDERRDSIHDRPTLLADAYTYPAVFSETVPRGVKTIIVKADDSGMLVLGSGGLEDILSNWDYELGRRPHLMYTIAQANNPTGYVVPLPRKREIYAVCKRYDVIIIEDEPYWHLQYPSVAADEARSRGLLVPPPTPLYHPAISSGYPFIDSKIPSFLSMDTDGRVIRLDTFSKTFTPGCRLGWITAQPDIIERYIQITETATQQPSGFTQGLVAQLLMGPPPSPPPSTPAPTSRFPFSLAFPFSRPPSAPAPPPAGWSTSGFVTWLTGLHTVYHRRMTSMCRILDAGSHLVTAPSPGQDEGGWTSVAAVPLLTFRWPAGGMFVWVRVRFENHPLFDTSSPRPVTGPLLSRALYMLLTDAPFRVAVSRGAMFAASSAIGDEDGWAFFRLCFAAETEENVVLASRGFVDGVHAFWGLGVEEVEGLLGRYPEGAVAGALGVGWMGC